MDSFRDIVENQIEYFKRFPFAENLLYDFKLRSEDNIYVQISKNTEPSESYSLWDSYDGYPFLTANNLDDLKEEFINLVYVYKLKQLLKEE